jgi:hypothetical protein
MELLAITTCELQSQLYPQVQGKQFKKWTCQVPVRAAPCQGRSQQRVHVPQRGYAVPYQRKVRAPANPHPTSTAKQATRLHPSQTRDSREASTSQGYLPTDNISLRRIDNITYRLIKTLTPLPCALRSIDHHHPYVRPSSLKGGAE